MLSIELPPTIVGAINRQTEQFYLIEEYRHRVVREAEESKRKQIEANGIAAFQKTVSQGISDSYLRWRGIEATLLLSQSQNSKIVVIGSGRDGLPIILGNVDTPSAPAALRKDSEAAPTSDNSKSAPQNALPPSSANSAPPAGAAPPGGQPAPAQPAPAAPAQSGPRSDNSAPAPDNKKAPAAQPPASAGAAKPVTFNLFDLSSYDSVLSKIIGNSRPGDTDTPSKPSAERQ